MLINVFLPPPPWTGIRITDLFMPLFSTFLHFPKCHFFVYCVRSVEMLLFGLGRFSSGWYQRRRMPQIPGYHGKRTTICFASVVVYWSCGLSPPFRSLLLCLSFQVSHLWFSCTLSPLFCLKQTHICAVRVMVATSEGNVLGLYLELWPSRSAAVPAQSTPTESPANPAHHKALVWIFKSLHPLHTHTQTQTHTACV